jgi:formate-dependent nitrite reductase membrane component NrfD
MAEPRRPERSQPEGTGAHDGGARDTTPATGAGGGPARWRRAREGAKVAVHRGEWRDGAWSFLFGRDTRYAAEHADLEGVRAAGRRQREGDPPAEVQTGMMKPPVWTWEVPLYFWLGGMAAGSSFVALACDLAGDERSAATARKVALVTVAPSPVLLILDLGRPARFFNMMRVFKPRSPMSMGAWCLIGFSNLAAASVAADLTGRRRQAKWVGGANAVLGGYLGSYTGVLLAATAVPVWARSRLFLGPIFVATGAATGAAACRLTLVARGLPVGHPTREALGRVETGAMAAELILSQVNDVRLGDLADALEHGKAGRWFSAGKWLVRAGLSLRLVRGSAGPWSHHFASAFYLGAGLCFRYAWVEAGKVSARDDEAVARTARARATAAEPGAALRVTQH